MVTIYRFANPIIKIQYICHEIGIIGIDGSCLHSLSEDDLREELGVSSKIMLRKIMACTS
jgi:hypothetical protein